MESHDKRLIIAVKKEHPVDEVLPRIEAAGIDETMVYKFLNVVLGRVALDADYDQVVSDLRQMPEVNSVEQEPDFDAQDGTAL